jgi:hypothetical protein
LPLRTEGLCALLLAAATGAFPSTLILRVLDERGQPAAARVLVVDPGGEPQQIEAADAPPLVAAHPNFPELGVIVRDRRSLKLPPGRLTMRVDRGTEYRRVQIALDGDGGEQAARLERWIDMAAKGWWSGDLHVHRAAADLPALLDAADLHFVPALTGWNDSSRVAASPPYNYEDERHWGAALFVNAKSPIRLYAREAEYPPPYATWSEARSHGAFIDLEKLIWWEAPVIAALIPPDSIGVAVNHFREDGVSTRASLARPRDESRYPGERGFARYILDLYSHYLSAGFRIPASAGSANGVAKNAIGYNRSYVYLGKKYSYDHWLAGQKAGRNFVTNGPMLLVRVNGELPGAVLPAGVRKARVDVNAMSAGHLERAEILVDGVVARTLQPSDPGSSIHATSTVSVEAGSWLVVRCFEKNDATVRFAQTSPVYFGESPRRSRESLAYLRDWVEAEMERIRAVPEAKLSAAQKEEFLALCRKALRFYDELGSRPQASGGQVQ